MFSEIYYRNFGIFLWIENIIVLLTGFLTDLKFSFLYSIGSGLLLIFGLTGLLQNIYLKYKVTHKYIEVPAEIFEVRKAEIFDTQLIIGIRAEYECNEENYVFNRESGLFPPCFGECGYIFNIKVNPDNPIESFSSYDFIDIKRYRNIIIFNVILFIIHIFYYITLFGI